MYTAVPVARYSACETAWHKRDLPVCQCADNHSAGCRCSARAVGWLIHTGTIGTIEGPLLMYCTYVQCTKRLLHLTLVKVSTPKKQATRTIRVLCDSVKQYRVCYVTDFTREKYSSGVVTAFSKSSFTVLVPVRCFWRLLATQEFIALFVLDCYYPAGVGNRIEICHISYWYQIPGIEHGL